MRFSRGRLRGDADPASVRYFREAPGGANGLELEPLTRAPWLGVETASGAWCSPRDIEPAVVVAPGKIVCIGRNYREHARELGHEVPQIPHVFLKATSSLLVAGGAIKRPVHMSQLVHHEGELAVVMGRPLRNAASTAEALAAVFGYTIANDVTARDLQREDKHFTRAKGFDTFCPVGPVIVSADEIGDPQTLDIEVKVDGESRQKGSTRDMVFSVGFILAHVSRIMTLEPGDLVLTGTPAGVGPLVAGNEVTVSISRIGNLSSSVIDGPVLSPIATA